MDNSEENGIGWLKCHSQLAPGESLVLEIENDLSYGGNLPKVLEIKVSSNDTVQNLRNKVGSALTATW